MMLCSICGKPVVLSPSAKERAAKYGGDPIDYIRLLPTHSDCAIAKREAETLELVRRITNGYHP